MGHIIREDTCGGFKILQIAVETLGEKECFELGREREMEERCFYSERKKYTMDQGLNSRKSETFKLCNNTL